jgi:3-oxoadipate enol-lactonase
VAYEELGDTLYVADIGTGPPVVLIHGLLATGEMFRWLAEALPTGFRLVTPDLPGHGHSRTISDPYTVEVMAARLGRSLDRHGIRGAHIMGYSHGGAVAQQLALQSPHLVHSLALVATYAHNTTTPRERLEGWLLPRLVRRLGTRRLAALIARPGTGGGPALTHDQLTWLRDMLAGNDSTAMAQAAADLAAFDSRGWLERLHMPTLVVSGEADTAVPAHHAAMLAAGIPGARTVTVPQAGHTMVWTHPHELARILTGWWNENPSLSPGP